MDTLIIYSHPYDKSLPLLTYTKIILTQPIHLKNWHYSRMVELLIRLSFNTKNFLPQQTMSFLSFRFGGMIHQQ